MRIFNNEQEQVEFLHELWETYGRVVILGLLAGIIMMFGWRYYQSAQVKYSEQASTLYEQILKSYQQKKPEVLAKHVQLLTADYPKTPYASLGALMQVRAWVEAGEMEQAKEQLIWVLAHSSDSAVSQIARIRLARLYGQLEQPEQGLALLEENDDSAFDLYTFEVKGDLYYRQGEHDKARNAYQSALQSGGDEAASHLLSMKLANLA